MNNRYFSILEEIKKKGGKLDDGHFNDKVLIIDGLNTFIRVFSVMPTLNDDGAHIGGIVGFLKSIGYAIHLFNPTRAIIVFDGKGGSTRRRKLFPEYKAGRRVKKKLVRAYDFNTPEEERQNMLMQLKRIVEYLELLPVSILSIDNIEADDTIGYLSKQVFDKSKITILSTDKDFLQLVNHRIKVYSPTKKKIYDRETLMEEYGIPSKNFLTYRILEGDKSDNIPGVKGAGLTRMKILSGIENPITELVKYKFETMFYKDKLFTSLPNLQGWLAQNFTQLNRYARMSHGKKA